jgi:ADP-ribosyl-[dinitrogen reductase] hydrolase
MATTSKTDQLRDRFRGALLGLACGDAVGTAVEFESRGEFEPVSDMVGGGCFDLEPGQWTDDTSMALCMAESLIEQGGFDARDQLERYCRWYRQGYLSSTGECFDIGGTVRPALEAFGRTGQIEAAKPKDGRGEGNGSIMRLAPAVLWAFPDRHTTRRLARASSKTTHSAAVPVAACEILGLVMRAALLGAPKDEVLLQAEKHLREYPATLHGIVRGEYRKKAEPEVSGLGWAVTTLEAALWAFARTDSFEEAILDVVNLGDDADSTGAVTGQIAGAFYGRSAIPNAWLERVWWHDQICGYADAIFDGRAAVVRVA